MLLTGSEPSLYPNPIGVGGLVSRLDQQRNFALLLTPPVGALFPFPLPIGADGKVARFDQPQRNSALLNSVILNFFPTGGVLISGVAPVANPLNFTVTPTGGVLVGATPPTATVYPVVAAGSVAVGGVAAIGDAYPLFIPSGGIKVAGTAVAFFLPVGTVSTTENPFADEFPGWAMNYETRAPSRYLGLPANSICRFSGKTYVANAGGIYEVTGTDDAGQPIHAAVTLPKTDFDDSHNKRIPDVFLSVRSAGTLLLKVLVNDKAGRYYGVTANPSYVRGTRAKLGKGLEARYWQFRLENMAGADFELADMEIKPTILTRHGV